MSIQAVARQAGVSVATVSRAFNQPDQVAPATRRQIEQAAQALGYLPNASARTLRTQRSRVLGVVLPTLVNPVFAECLQGMAEAAAQAGHALMPLTTDYEVAREEQAVNHLLAANVAGLVLVVANPSQSGALRRLQARALPYVLAYHQHPEHPCVGVDGEQAVADLVARLVAQGHRHITMVSGQRSASDRAEQRCRGYQRGMAAAGLPAEPVLEVPFMAQALQDIVARLRRAPVPTALLASNDLLALRCLRAAHLAGRAVPTQLSVVGFDGIALGADLTPMLSTITQPNADLGQQSIALLLQALADGQALGPSASRTLAHGFRQGESCAPPRTATA
ncbi:LacI family DNA-binding transcriptional regulator [Curvibacter sp. HBC61]|uniref:LacI family DNA-binding transcriptional regulator n=1 Tax=Curvibacter cyanobacteriorum TaxID=3026422 RepID=A0ABT5N2M2_9BURK|nr:LacI family DNA-binding transcriptional regulator [Curvibacter sp. HBC61]MDD0840554.1 LacI family DNA-binding transcriptional regulator [Curvibacter sp. HBC61]